LGKIINIVVDTSGSMTEDDKNGVVKYLLNGINNISETTDFKNIEFILYQWGSISKKIGNIDKAKLEFAGRGTIEGLDELSKMIDDNQALIFISDGNFTLKETEKIKKLSKSIVSIFIGVDANRLMLQKVSSEKIVYSVTDFVQAIYDIYK
jgi:hypothetical protein